MLEFDVLFNCLGKEVIIKATKDMMFAELALKFMDVLEIITDDQPEFIFNSMKIPMDCCKSLDELKIKMSSRIEVFTIHISRYSHPVIYFFNIIYMLI